MFKLQATDGTYDITPRSILGAVVEDVAAKLKGTRGDALLTVWKFVSGEISATDAAGKIVVDALESNATTAAALKTIVSNKFVDFVIDSSPDGFKLKTLSEAPTGLEYALPVAKTDDLKAGDVTLSAGLNGQASATIDVFVAPQAATDPPLAIAANDAVLRFALHGSVGVSGAASLPINGGTADASGKVSAGVDLDALYQWPASSTVAGALFDSAQSVVSPWDIDAVAAALRAPDGQGRYRGLRQLVMHCSGSISLAGSVALGRQWSYGTTFASGKPLKLALGAQGKVAATWSRSGDFRFVVTSPAPGIVDVDVQRASDLQQSLGVDLTASLDVSGLGQVVQPIVDRYFKDPGRLMAKLQQWSAPGTLLEQALLARIPADAPEIKALAQLLLGQTTIAAIEAQVRTLVAQEVHEIVDTALPFWEQIENPAALATSIATEVVRRLGVGAPFAADLAKALSGYLTPAISDVKQAFDTDVQQIATAAGTAVGTLLTPLATIGEDVDAIVKQVNQDASNVIAPLIRLLSKYAQIRTRVYKAVALASKLKLGLGIQASYTKDTSREAEIALSFDSAKLDDTGRAIWRALLTGRLGSVSTLLPAAIASGQITLREAAYTTAISRNKTLSLSVVFGDDSVAIRQAQTSDVKVTVDANGMLTLGESRFSTSTVTSGFGASNSVSFGGTLDVAGALRQPDAAADVTLGFALEYANQGKDPARIAAYLGSLQRGVPAGQLVAPGAAQAAANAYQGFSSARIDTSVQLTAAQVARLVQVATNQPDLVLHTARLYLFQTLGSLDSTTAPFVEAAQPQTAEGIADLFDAIAQRKFVAASELNNFLAQRSATPPQGSGMAPLATFDAARNIEQRARGLLAALLAMRDIPSVLANAVAQAGANLPPDEADLYAAALDATNASINQGFGGWITPNGLASVGHWTVALLATLAQLAGAATPLLTPLVKLTSSTGEVRLLSY